MSKASRDAKKKRRFIAAFQKRFDESLAKLRSTAALPKTKEPPSLMRSLR